MKHGFATRKCCRALRFTATKLPLHTSVASASYRRKRCLIVIRRQIRTATRQGSAPRRPEKHRTNGLSWAPAPTHQNLFTKPQMQRYLGQIRIGESLPPGVSIACGKLGGTRSVTEGACAALNFDETLPQRAFPQSPAAPAFGPGRKHGLLPALAKNMPPAYFLNASRPPGGSLRTRNRMGMGFALSLCNTEAKLVIKQNDK